MPCNPNGRAYELLAHAVLLSAVRDANFWKVKNKVGADLSPTPGRQVFMARRFLTTEDECGGWCMMAGFDPALFTVRMKAKLVGE